MAKVRVYELAKELNIESKELVDKLKAGGMDVKNYMSTLDDDEIKKAKEILKVKPSIEYRSAVKSSNFVLFTPDSKVLVSAIRNQRIDVIHVEDGQLLSTLDFPDRIDDMQFSTDGTRLNIMGSSVQSWGVR